MTIGKKWRETSKHDQIMTAEAKRRDDDEKTRRMAAEIIAGIPARVKAALAKNEPSIQVSEGWVDFSDVAGTHPDKVDQLVERLGRENRVLRAGDLAGVARIVFEWCDANDLECFFVAESIPLNEDEYNLHARPKRA